MRILIILLFCFFPLCGQDSTKTAAEKSQELWQKLIAEKSAGKSLVDLTAELLGVKPLEVDTTSGYIKAIKKCGQAEYEKYLRQLRLYNRIWAVLIIESLTDISEDDKLQIFVDAFVRECVSPIDKSIIGGQRADHRMKERLIMAIFRYHHTDKILLVLKEKYKIAKGEVLKYLNCLMAKCGDNTHNKELKKYLQKDKDPLIRGLAAEGLGVVKDTTAIELLKRAMQDTTCYYEEAWLFTDLQDQFPRNRRYYVRNQAASALKELGIPVEYRYSSEGIWEPYIVETKE
ncbi:MAG: HEAT repeat domain-containing protein [candidate division WOR-3 bacterium]